MTVNIVIIGFVSEKLLLTGNKIMENLFNPITSAKFTPIINLS